MAAWVSDYNCARLSHHGGGGMTEVFQIVQPHVVPLNFIQSTSRIWIEAPPKSRAFGGPASVTTLSQGEEG